ncbi:hypothetical protein [Streptomyces cucumeris]|uniref:hypothetical protein n=1 Tax=Streptomyces cucumeris TaxID=2962890 RepID=UPI0020C8F0AF|nr:hypothetical protein [Streptomyces sp. NEAU-Y11]MCP9209697.1 hypothetical protein [Streptomyces sp. NEAU-Y11]
MAAKWNGKSLHQLTQKQKRIDGLTVALHELSNLLNEAQKDHLSELGRILDRGPDDIVVGNWGCGDSPIGLCVYSAALGGEDECLLCGEPSERK